MVAPPVGSGSGKGKMCEMTCSPHKIDVSKLMPLVNAPKFICRSCAHVANKKKQLCRPVALK